MAKGETKGTPAWLRIGIGTLAGFGLLVVGVIAFGALSANRASDGAAATVEQASAPAVALMMKAIENQVAKDSEAQYQIAKRGGDPAETCAHAGLVPAAYLQARDEPNYTKWKAVEKADCAAAGVPK